MEISNTLLLQIGTLINLNCLHQFNPITGGTSTSNDNFQLYIFKKFCQTLNPSARYRPLIRRLLSFSLLSMSSCSSRSCLCWSTRSICSLVKFSMSTGLLERAFRCWAFWERNLARSLVASSNWDNRQKNPKVQSRQFNLLPYNPKPLQPGSQLHITTQSLYLCLYFPFSSNGLDKSQRLQYIPLNSHQQTQTDSELVTR